MLNHKAAKIFKTQLVLLLLVAIGSYFGALYNGLLLRSGQLDILEFKIIMVLIILMAFVLVALVLYKAAKKTHEGANLKNLLISEKALLKLHNRKLEDLNISMRNVNQAISIIAANDRIEWVNPAFTDMFGYTEDEAIGKMPSDLLAGPETDLELIKEIDKAVFENLQSYDTTIVHYRKDKSKLWAKIHITPILNKKHGGLLKYIAVSTDITESKKAQDNLAESEANFAQIAETVNDVIYLYDIKNNQYEYISSNSLKILGVDKKYFYSGISRKHLKYHEDDEQNVRNANTKVDAGEPYKIEYRIQIGDEWRWIEERSFPILDVDGNVTRNSGVCSDITDKKKVEEELKLSIDKTTILAEIGLEISEDLSITHIIQTTHSKVSSLMPAESFSIGIFDKTTNEIRFPYIIDANETFENVRVNLDKKILATICFNEEKEIIIEDYEKDYDTYFEGKGPVIEGGSPNSIVYLPILNLGKAIGVITVQSANKNAYNEGHISMLRNISIYVSHAIFNINILDSLEETVANRTLKVQEQKNEIESHLKDAQILGEIGIELSRTLKLDEIFEKMLDSLDTLLDATIFSIRIYNDETQTIDYNFTIEKGERFDPITVPMTDNENLTVWCIKNKKSIFINDHSDIEKYTKTAAVPMGEMPTSMIFTPMIVNEEIQGVITVQSFELNAYTERDLQIMKTLAFYLGIAYSNGVLFETLEDKVDERTKEVKEKTNEIMQSIRYAQVIQNATLTKREEVQNIFQDSFLVYEPKDIVSGDFYNASTIKTNDQTELKSIVVADCTGHGVPGAVLAITCNNIIQSTYSNPNVNTAGEALDFTRNAIGKLFSQSDDILRDGMDVSWGVWNTRNDMLYFSGAFNNCYILRNKEVITLKGDRMHVGYDDNPSSFNTLEYQLEKGDIVFLTTDGYVDQFGGSAFKKFSRKRLFDEMKSLDERPLKDQGPSVLKTFKDWKGEEEQTDDVCLFSFRVY